MEGKHIGKPIRKSSKIIGFPARGLLAGQGHFDQVPPLKETIKGAY